MRKQIITFLSIILFPLLIIIGFSSWIIVGEKKATVGQNSTVQAVAHVLDSSGAKTYDYTNVCAAINDANNLGTATVVIKPGTNPSIDRDCTINSGVTLNIPYAIGNDGYTPVACTGKAATGGSSVLADLNTALLKNTVYVEENVTIKNNGTIIIGGILDAGGPGKPSGQTASDYSKISMKANSKIITSSGNIYCYGFIDEYFAQTLTEDLASIGNGSEIIFESGTLFMPFVVRDFRGGTNTSGIVLGQSSYRISPFNQFDLRNVRTKIILNYGAIVKAWSNIYMSSTVYNTEMNFIGTTSAYFGQMHSGSRLEMKINSITEVCKFDFYGGMSMNYIELTISGQTASTKEVYLPLSFRQDITVHDGTYNVATQRIKLLPGSKFKVEENATLSAAEINVYPSSFSGYGFGGVDYPSGKGEPILMVNGTFNCNILGGIVYTSSASATLKVTTVTSTSKEITAIRSVFGVPLGIKSADSFTSKLKLYMYNNGKVDSTLTEVSAGTYTSINDKINYGWIKSS